MNKIYLTAFFSFIIFIALLFLQRNHIKKEAEAESLIQYIEMEKLDIEFIQDISNN
jgi:hypothetical protein